MPRFDGTGPLGQGPRTGRGMGPCGGGMGRGGWGGGYGSGFGFGGRQFISPKNELAVLKENQRALEEELAIVKEEIAALTKQQK